MPIPIQNAVPNASLPGSPAVKPRPVAVSGTEVAATALPQATPGVDPAALRRAVESINRRLEQSVNNLRFSVDDDTGKVVVKVLDTATEQVIRQIPSEEALAISRSLEKLQGLLLNQQA